MSCQAQPSQKERVIGAVRCKKEGMLMPVMESRNLVSVSRRVLRLEMARAANSSVFRQSAKCFENKGVRKGGGLGLKTPLELDILQKFLLPSQGD